MREQELAAELNDPGSQQLLRHGRLARLAYAGTDGFPRVIPIGFLWQGERVYMCTASIAPKVKAIAARPEVALTIDTDDGPARALLIRGKAEIEIVDGVPPEYIAASAKTMDPAELESFETNVRGIYRQMARIAVIPAWARFYDFGAGRIPAFLQELVAGG
jgi:hypothetical protein